MQPWEVFTNDLQNETITSETLMHMVFCRSADLHVAAICIR